MVRIDYSPQKTVRGLLSAGRLVGIVSLDCDHSGIRHPWLIVKELKGEDGDVKLNVPVRGWCRVCRRSRTIKLVETQMECSR